MEPFLSWDVSSEYLKDKRVPRGSINLQYKLQNSVTCYDLHLCQQSDLGPLDAFNSMGSPLFDGNGKSTSKLSMRVNLRSGAEIADWDRASLSPTANREYQQEECRESSRSHRSSMSLIGFGQEGASPSMDYMEKKIAHPFDMLKRGKTVEGCVTLEDINNRILMPPTRPVKHPVDKFDAPPPCASSRSFGITGKTKVAIAKVRTQGRGAITVIRTKIV